MGYMLLLFVITLAVQAHGVVYKCNDEVIARIETLWSISGKPKDVLKTLKANGRGALIASAIPDHYTPYNYNYPQCVFGDFEGNSVTFTVVQARNKLYKTTVKYSESDGVLTDQNTHEKRYIIFNNNGVTPYYTCGESVLNVVLNGKNTYIEVIDKLI